MTRTIDLHCHSDQSDGILSPEALVSRAKVKDVAVLALTDHDTVAGVQRARQQGELEGLQLINGIEFSCDWGGRAIHVLGLNVALDADSLTHTIAKQDQRRALRAERIAEKLAKLGMSGTLEGAKKIAKEAVLGRPHFAQYLVEAGHCKNVAQAFTHYLGAGKVGDIKQIWPDLHAIVEVIVDSGGVAVLAHPNKYNMTRTKLCAMVSDFKDAGGRAIEVVSGIQNPGVTQNMALIARKFDLLASCGSDFHSADNEWQELGKFSPLPADLEPVWSVWD